jgi:tripartite-type tricarboxylate transporter receptor subunit TctC
MFRRTFLWLGITFVGAFPCWAQDYPSRPVRIVVPYSAGGGVDVVARIIAVRLAAQLGQPFIVENKPGGGGAIGVDSVAKAAPDGYTLLFTANSTHTTAPHLTKSLPYDTLKDFTPIATVIDYSFTLVVNPRIPVNSVAELVTYAKANPNSVTFSSAGPGSGTHLAGELLKSATGAPMLHVPYKGNAPALMAGISGEVTCLFDTTGTAINHIRSGQVRPLAVTSLQRNRMLPDLPTMIEAGISDFDVVGWYGFLGPANLPSAVTNKLIPAIKTIMGEPAVEEQLRAQGFDINVTALAEFAARIKADHSLWGKVVQQANIQIN